MQTEFWTFFTPSPFVVIFIQCNNMELWQIPSPVHMIYEWYRLELYSGLFFEWPSCLKMDFSRILARIFKLNPKFIKFKILYSLIYGSEVSSSIQPSE